MHDYLLLKFPMIDICGCHFRSQSLASSTSPSKGIKMGSKSKRPSMFQRQRQGKVSHVKNQVDSDAYIALSIPLVCARRCTMRGTTSSWPVFWQPLQRSCPSSVSLRLTQDKYIRCALKSMDTNMI